MPQHISQFAVTVRDYDEALAFYVDKLGFEKRTDVPFGGGMRWIEVYPPGGTSGIALAPPPNGADAEVGVQTGITITTDDIDATHAKLKDADVDVDAEVARYGDPVPPIFWLRDHDANVLMVVQTPPR